MQRLSGDKAVSHVDDLRAGMGTIFGVCIGALHSQGVTREELHEIIDVAYNGLAAHVCDECTAEAERGPRH